MEKEGIKIAKTALRTKNKGGGITLPDIRVHSRATIISTVWYWWNDRQLHKSEQGREPRKRPTQICPFNFLPKSKKQLSKRKTAFFFKKLYWKIGYLQREKLSLNLNLIPTQKLIQNAS